VGPGSATGGVRSPKKKVDVSVPRAMALTRSTSLGQFIADQHFLVADVVNASKQVFMHCFLCFLGHMFSCIFSFDLACFFGQQIRVENTTMAVGLAP
jgi:hypothetical protein